MVESQLKLDAKSDRLVEVWNQIKQRSQSCGISLWDGVYYRLENLEEVRRGERLLKLSTIRYSTVCSLVEIHRQSPLPKEEYPLHMNTGALIRTRDELFVFGLKRSGKNPIQVDLVGGGLQSSELEVKSGSDLSRNLLKEMKEEINVEESHIASLRLAGAVLSDSMSFVLIFAVQLTVDFSQLKNLFEHRADDELFDLVGIPESELSSFFLEQKGYLRILDPMRGRPGADAA